jgi:hypothetical protein
MEEENRAAMCRARTREAETAHGAQDCLGATEHRLAAMELTLRDLVSELSRRRL